MQHKIRIVDNGASRYELVPFEESRVLGRRYDNNAEQIIVDFPKQEINNGSSCIMIVTSGFTVVENIPIQNGVPVSISSNISQYSKIRIGFSFIKDNTYIKNTETIDFIFLPALKPYDFVPSDSGVKLSFEKLLAIGIADVVMDGSYLVFKNINGEEVNRIELEGFAQVQSDLSEQDDTKTSFVKNKYLSNFNNDVGFVKRDELKTRLSEFDNDKQFATEQFVEESIANLHTGEGGGEVTFGVNGIKLNGEIIEKDQDGIVDIVIPEQEPSITMQDVNNAIYDNIGFEQQIDYNAVLQGTEIVASIDESVGDFTFKQNSSYLFHIYLPLVTLTGDLNDNYLLYLTDKAGNRIHLNCMYEKDITKTSTVGDFCQIQDYDIGIGYSWEFNGHYREINDGGTIRRVIYVDTITRETNPSMTGQNLHDAITNTKLKVGTTVYCSEDYAYNGYSYIANHTYKVTGDWASGELILDVEDLTASAGSSVKTLTYDDTTLGEHVMEILGHINSENGGSLLSVGFKVGVNSISATATNIQFNSDGNLITSGTVTPFTKGDYVNCTLKHINDNKTGAYFNCGINQISNATLEIYKDASTTRVLLGNNQLTSNAGNGSPLLTFYNNVDISNMALEHLTITYHL